MRSLLAVAACVAVTAAAPAARAQTTYEALGGFTVGGSLGLATDYLFRGVSQTQTGPAIQGTIDIEHSSGFYIGGFASNVDFAAPADANIELDGLAGFRFQLFDINFDIGGIYYAYPGASDQPFTLNYFEIALKAWSGPQFDRTRGATVRA
jgi:uncharacterized protein (TIGR02001 family)